MTGRVALQPDWTSSMATDVITLKVLTPAGLVLEDKASSVTVPSALGEIQILPQHARYSGLLGTGILEYQPVGNAPAKRMVISQGFFNLSGDVLDILADYVVQAEQVDRGGYAAQRPTLEKTVAAGNTTEPEFAVAKEQLGRIEAIDRLLGVH